MLLRKHWLEEQKHPKIKALEIIWWRFKKLIGLFISK